MSGVLALFPHHTTIDAGGHLSLDGCRAADLAAQFGTPLYVYHLDTIRRRIAAYRQALDQYPGPSRLTYASKAFLCVELARFMSHQGVGLEVSSAGELYIARQAGADPAQLHMHGNNKSRLDLEEAVRQGVGRIVVDNPAELARLSAVARGQPRPVSIWLRVTPGIPVDTPHRYTVTGTVDSKFGMPPDEALAAARRLLQAGPDSPLRLAGLHTHLGSHFHQPAPVVQAIDSLLNLARSLHEETGWVAAEICPGGGWGVPYHPADPPMPVAPFVTALAGAVADACRRRNLPLPTLVLEPGRSLVAQAGVALYTVGGRKEIPGLRTYISVDGGLADNPRPALYGARYTALLANRAAEPPTETVTVAGPYCESGDILIEQVDLPPARPGDLLAVPVSGAYQLSMSSNYNAALRPAVVFIERGTPRLVQRRETFADLVRRDITAATAIPESGAPAGAGRE